MKEFRSYESVLKVNDKIAIGEKVCFGGYEYTKVDKFIYTNNSSIIKIETNLSTPYAVFSYKKGVKKAKIYNQFGQQLNDRHL